MGRFYPNGSPAPRRMPKYLVVTPTGAWAYSHADEALSACSQLTSNGVKCHAVIHDGSV